MDVRALCHVSLPGLEPNWISQMWLLWSQNQIKPQEVFNKSLLESLPQKDSYGKSHFSFPSAPEGEQNENFKPKLLL